MPNSSRGSFYARRSGTVTVIEEPVRRSTTRNAKIAACVVWVIVTLLSATVLASRWHPVLALLAGVLCGAAAAFLIAIAVLIWPVVRVIWWWLPEITLAAALVAAWVWLADHVRFPYLLGVVTVTVALPAVIPQVRRAVVALVWCLVVRHRIRTCFAEFIVYNRTGSLPLILQAVPTPAGERVSVFLRPGLSLDAIQARLPQIAVACWASSATATAASVANSARIRLDIKRRDALTGTVISPLLSRITPAPVADRDISAVPTALDLPDITAAEVQPPATRPVKADKKPAPDQGPVVVPGAGDDLTDWL